MRLIVVSNRLNLQISKDSTGFIYKPSSGGLATGLKCVKSSIDFIWVGNVTNIPLEDQSIIEKDCWVKYQSVPVFISKELNERSYNNFCNSFLWPALHSFIDIAQFNQLDFEAYVKFNQQFASRILDLVEENDTVWVHDYHLMHLPLILKKSKKKIKVAFFLHTPFPSKEVFEKLPKGKSILMGILGASKIGFHSNQYKTQFIDTCKKMLKKKDYEKLKVFVCDKSEDLEREIKECSKKVTDISIKEQSMVNAKVNDKAKVNDQSMNQSNDQSMNQSMNQSKVNDKTKVNDQSNDKSNDKENIKISKKLDEISGSINIVKSIDNGKSIQTNVNGFIYTPNSILIDQLIQISAIPIGIDATSFQNTLKKENVINRIKQIKETYKKKIVLGVDRTDYIKGMIHRIKPFEELDCIFIQIGVPSRLNIFEYQKIVDQIKLKSCLNENFIFKNSSVDFDELCALYASADALLITSLRDGMNLVALEYVVCNKNPIVLSKFAGACNTLPGALNVNPWSTNDIVKKVNEALKMTNQEKEKRYKVNMENVSRFSAVEWAKSNLEMLIDK